MPRLAPMIDQWHVCCRVQEYFIEPSEHCELAMAVPYFDDDPEDVQQQPHHQNLPVLNNPENVQPDENDDQPSGRIDVSDVSYACSEDDTDDK